MKISEKWLRSFINPKVSNTQLIYDLSMIGLEVNNSSNILDKIKGVVVGEIKSVKKHPNTDKYQICQIDTCKEIVQVISGSKNIKEGLKIPFAMIGSKVPTLDSKIAKIKFNGISSFGILCSFKTLNIGNKSDYLIELPYDAAIGRDVCHYLQLYDDVILDICVPPNRGDCLSVLGIARELSAIYNIPIKQTIMNKVIPVDNKKISIKNLYPEDCPLYLGRIIKNIDLNKQPPLFISERLMISEINNINTVIDITNYVMLELGAPIQAFDLDKIEGNMLCIRKSTTGEKFISLDEKEIFLKKDTLIMEDYKNILAISGVISSKKSNIDNITTNIYLEVANYNNVSLLGTARTYGINTESSQRFEKGVDSTLSYTVIERITQLLLDIVGGDPCPIVEVINNKYINSVDPIILRATRLKKVIGISINSSEVIRLLKAIKCSVQELNKGYWIVKIPSHRFDLRLEIDLIEELARLYGYNNIYSYYAKINLLSFNKSNIKSRNYIFNLKRLLVSRGYQEVITFSFIENELFKLFHPHITPLSLINPISKDMKVMRSSLWPGLIKIVKKNLNINKNIKYIKLFEHGNCFIGELEKLKQESMLAGVVCCSTILSGWNNSKKFFNFFDLKSDIEAILEISNLLNNCKFKIGPNTALHPGQNAIIEEYNGDVVGYIGLLHPSILKTLDIPYPIFLFELRVDPLKNNNYIKKIDIFSHFPEMARDLSLLVPKSIQAQTVFDNIKENAGPLLIKLILVDVYCGENIDVNKNGFTIRLIWQHKSRTLKDIEINNIINNIISNLEYKLNITVRV